MGLPNQLSASKQTDKSSQVKSSQVKSSQVKSSQVKSSSKNAPDRSLSFTLKPTLYRHVRLAMPLEIAQLASESGVWLLQAG